jgi:hypothetical protein
MFCEYFIVCFQPVVRVGAVMKDPPPPAIRVEVLSFTSWPVTDDIGNELFNNTCWVQMGVVLV